MSKVKLSHRDAAALVGLLAGEPGAIAAAMKEVVLARLDGSGLAPKVDAVLAGLLAQLAGGTGDEGASASETAPQRRSEPSGVPR